MKNWKITLIGLVLCLILSACFPATPAPTPTPTAVFTKSEEFVTAAWKALGNNQFNEAINFAQECINKWESEAVKQQSALTQEPPNGKVTADEKKTIFANWALNDVSTAYFIKASALEKLGKTTETKDAYAKVITFPYARCWDPSQELFWSPAGTASDNLARMPQ